MATQTVRSAGTHRALSRVGSLAAAALLCTAGLAATAATAGAVTTSPDSAAGYLAARLAAHGGHVVTEFGNQTYDDHGMTADVVFALQATDSGAAAARTATSFLAENVDAYIGADGDTYAGSTAKLLTVAVSQGQDPRAFGGQDLVARLQSTMQPSGRFSDTSQWGDYSNTIGQSWAVLGLDRAGAGPDAAAVTFLRQQQCDDGGFRLDFSAATCNSDTDATAFAVQALVAVAGAGDTDVREATDWLAGKIQADGGVGGTGPTVAVNANSSGMAAAAFTAAGRDAEAAKVRGFLRTLQFGCTAAESLRGAYAYNADGLQAAEPTAQIDRATAQAVIGASGQSYVDVSADGDQSAPVAADCSDPGEDPGDDTRGSGSLGSLTGNTGSLGSLTGSLGS